ncbi:MAG TPA: ABC transporter permease subunit [Burkholderiales bacterium]|nr:ABC transporter permease subunit [Burkholderiales bacterium]
MRARAAAVQLALLAAVAFVLWYLASNTAANLEARKIASGFAFLGREAGFEIGEAPFLGYGAADSYARAIVVGLINTFRVAVIGIALATLLGMVLGLARLSRNWLLAKFAAGYIEVVRNVPLLVQLFFLYAVITENLPGPREALSPLAGVYFSNRGIAFPLPAPHAAHAWVLAALLAGAVLAWGLARWARARQARTGQPFPVLGAGAALVLGLPLAVFLAAGAPLALARPEMQGFNFAGGAILTPEFATLLFGLTLYTAAFIAEIVRAGVQAVDRGQSEAAYSLGLPRSRTTRLVILPQALRVIVPPLTSQYLNLTKNSSLAVAIGYPDLVSIANTTMNQTGQAIEGIAIIMAVYLTISLSISALMNWYNARIALKGARR